ncbi:hypothetical protein KFE25_009061 [Diacronema lutheri]|uniref:SNF2 super family n=2 Tax=Diacronema lutheri TaxID=2081491 RepID=A0A8J5XZ61_DIALT|nr:hypothetical protein KFE25_009061 [Diacronema lutheri]
MRGKKADAASGSEWEPSEGESAAADEAGSDASSLDDFEVPAPPRGRSAKAATKPRSAAAASSAAPSAAAKPAAKRRQPKKAAAIKGEDEDALAAPKPAAKRGRPKKAAAGEGEDDDAPAKGAKKPKAKKTVETGKFCIQHAPTGRAKCRVCGTLIPAKALRFGVEEIMSGYGEIMCYRHLACSRLPLGVPLSNVDGLSELDESERALVESTLLSTSPLDHLTEADPDEVLRSSVIVHTAEREPPATITTPLLCFQRIGLAWMCEQERSEVRGGILADEMGMGKTIQTLALIATHRNEQRLPADRPPPATHPALVEEGGGGASGSASASSVQTCRPCRHAGGTLVICPVIALVQWQAELAKNTDGSLSVFVYHGNKRPDAAAQLAQYDVVLTSYSTVESDYRRVREGSMVPCAHCGKLLQPDKLEIHLRWFCGPEARRSAAQSKTEKKKARSGQAGTTLELEVVSTKAKGRARGGGKRRAQPESSEEEAVESERDDDDNDDDDDDDGRVAAEAALEDDEEEEEEDGSRCLTCGGAKSSMANPLLLCDAPGCDNGQHIACARLRAVPEGDWLCAPCSSANGGTKLHTRKGAGTAKRGAGNGAVRTADRNARALRFYGLAPQPGDDDDDDDDDGGGGGGNDGGNGGDFDSDDEENAARAAIGQRSVPRGKQPARNGASKVCGARSVLHEVLWQRVVLDEAHAVKDRRCSTAQAVFALRSSLRWALSGTPLQNRVGELYSLVQYLRLDPLSFYCCSTKGCACKSREYRFTDGWRKCVICGHSPLKHFSVFNKTILNPIKKFGYVGEGRTAMLALKEQVFDVALLRRTKAERAADIALPPKLVKVRRDLLDDKELDFYNAIYTQSVAQFDTYVQRGVLLNNYAHIFDLLTRLRQAVDHPYLVLHSARAEEEAASALSIAHGGRESAVKTDDVCCLCHEIAVDKVHAACKHAFCRSCALEFIGALAEGATAQCPKCWRPLTIDLEQTSAPEQVGAPLSLFATPGLAGAAVPIGSSITGRSRRGILSRLNLAQFQSSTKIEALMEELSMMGARDPVGKAIVFSQFTSMLDLIEWRIQRGNVQAVKLDGSMSVSARSSAIDAFMTNPNVKVILISLKAGGVALNLTVATHIFLMDPWWNPAAEMQAIDRAHRIGQHKPVRAVRFIAKNTVEERIVALQEKKRLVFEGTVGGDMGALARLSEEDMRFLFQS